MVTEAEQRYLQRSIELAAQALAAGDEPFGSLLVGADGTILREERNQVGGGDATLHPELALARWAAQHLSPAERAAATVYTSGEHCPMCATAHGWVGLGRIVYVSSAEQLGQWLQQCGVPAAPVRMLPIQALVPTLEVEGPIPALIDQIRRLHFQRWGQTSADDDA